MTNNAFIDILFNWDKMSKQKRIQRLQDLENMIARFQGRKARIITTKLDKKFIEENIGVEREPEAYYSRQDRTKIYITTLNIEAIDAIKNIIHEGFHAYIDDFLSGRVKVLKLYSELPKEMFFIQEENLPAIHTHFFERKMMPLYDSFFIEERLNYQEDSLYIAKMIIDAIDTPIDSIRLTETFIIALALYCSNERRGVDLEREYGITYDDMVVESLNREGIEKEKIVTNGKISDKLDLQLLDFFKKACSKYQQFGMVTRSAIMMQAAKSEEESKRAQEISMMFNEYMYKILKQKNKI